MLEGGGREKAENENEESDNWGIKWDETYKQMLLPKNKPKQMNRKIITQNNNTDTKITVIVNIFRALIM